MTAPSFDLERAKAHLVRDRRLAEVIGRARDFELRREPGQGPYEALARAIVYQSISGKAAATIWGRVRACGDDGSFPSPDRIRRMRLATLRGAGLSAAKAAAFKDLARAARAGIVPTLEQALALEDEALMDRLVTIRGIGRWTVEMLLIFHLGRPDVLPTADLGVQKGFALTYGWPKPPTPRQLAEYGERWRPYRTVAAWYLWRAVELAAAAKRVRAAANGVT